jgi:hypothetical protein
MRAPDVDRRPARAARAPSRSPRGDGSPSASFGPADADAASVATSRGDPDRATAPASARASTSGASGRAALAASRAASRASRASADRRLDRARLAHRTRLRALDAKHRAAVDAWKRAALADARDAARDAVHAARLDASRAVRDADARVAEAEARARVAETRARAAETRASEANVRAVDAETREARARVVALERRERLARRGERRLATRRAALAGRAALAAWRLEANRAAEGRRRERVVGASRDAADAASRAAEHFSSAAAKAKARLAAALALTRLRSRVAFKRGFVRDCVDAWRAFANARVEKRLARAEAKRRREEDAKKHVEDVLAKHAVRLRAAEALRAWCAETRDALARRRAAAMEAARLEATLAKKARTFWSSRVTRDATTRWRELAAVASARDAAAVADAREAFAASRLRRRLAAWRVAAWEGRAARSRGESEGVARFRSRLVASSLRGWRDATASRRAPLRRGVRAAWRETLSGVRFGLGLNAGDADGSLTRRMRLLARAFGAGAAWGRDGGSARVPPRGQVTRGKGKKNALTLSGVKNPSPAWSLVVGAEVAADPGFARFLSAFRTAADDAFPRRAAFLAWRRAAAATNETLDAFRDRSTRRRARRATTRWRELVRANALGRAREAREASERRTRRRMRRALEGWWLTAALAASREAPRVDDVAARDAEAVKMKAAAAAAEEDPDADARPSASSAPRSASSVRRDLAALRWETPLGRPAEDWAVRALLAVESSVGSFAAEGSVQLERRARVARERLDRDAEARDAAFRARLEALRRETLADDDLLPRTNAARAEASILAELTARRPPFPARAKDSLEEALRTLVDAVVAAAAAAAAPPPPPLDGTPGRSSSGGALSVLGDTAFSRRGAGGRAATRTKTAATVTVPRLPALSRRA